MPLGCYLRWTQTCAAAADHSHSKYVGIKGSVRT